MTKRLLDIPTQRAYTAAASSCSMNFPPELDPLDGRPMSITLSYGEWHELLWGYGQHIELIREDNQDACFEFLESLRKRFKVEM